MKLRGDMSGIFHELCENRRERELATHAYGVFPIGSRGQVLKTASSTHRTAAEAEKMRQNMETLNPGKRFVVNPL